MFGSMEVREVESGTIIAHDKFGNPMVVTDGSAVFSDKIIFVTKKTFDALKAKGETDASSQ